MSVKFRSVWEFLQLLHKTKSLSSILKTFPSVSPVQVYGILD